MGAGSRGSAGELLPQCQEVHVFAECRARIAKERGMRRQMLKCLQRRLKEISSMKNLSCDELLMELAAARQKAPAA
jgi:hypothetical protein